MHTKEILKIKNIIPAVILLTITLLYLLNSKHSATISPGTALYEKNDFGYKKVHTTRRRKTGTLLKKNNTYYKIRIAQPDTTLWAPAFKIQFSEKFPALLLLNTDASSLTRETSPFKERINKEIYKAAKKGKTISFTTHTLYFLFSGLLLIFFLLTSKHQLVKNISAIIIGAILTIHTIYSSGIIKTEQKQKKLLTQTTLAKIKISKSVIYCPDRYSQEIIQALKGKSVKVIRTGYPRAISGRYALWHFNLGRGWKKISGGSRYNLFYAP